MRRAAVFLDRDGVLVPDRGPTVDPTELEPFAYAPRALTRLGEAGYVLVVVSNQPVVARGLASEDQVAQVHEHIQRMLRDRGSWPIDRFYFCPHHPAATLVQYRVACECRK